jgi:hypothetical protein
MKLYTCFFLSAENQIRGCWEFEARKDADAINAARAYHKKERIWHGFELWRGRCLVHIEAQDPNAAWSTSLKA